MVNGKDLIDSYPQTLKSLGNVVKYLWARQHRKGKLTRTEKGKQPFIWGCDLPFLLSKSQETSTIG